MQNIPIPLMFPIPKDEDDFEDLCVEVLRLYWKRPRLERYGSKGQGQHGVDILDLGGMEHICPRLDARSSIGVSLRLRLSPPYEGQAGAEDAEIRGEKILLSV